MSTDNIGREQLRAYAERVIRLEDEKQAITDDLKELASEIKAAGYSTKAFKSALKRHRMSSEDREQADLFESEVELYTEVMDGND